MFEDCHWALRLNENSFKARLYRAKAHKELEEFDKLEESRKELDEMFPQHQVCLISLISDIERRVND